MGIVAYHANRKKKKKDLKAFLWADASSDRLYSLVFESFFPSFFFFGIFLIIINQNGRSTQH